MNREQLKHLAVSATVTFPATYPRLAEIRLRQGAGLFPTNGDQETTFLVAAERPSVRVTMKRVLPVSDVRAIFVPRDPNCVHPDDGVWLLGSEIEAGVQLQINNRGHLYGIVYVAEQTATLLEVEAGMTAAESTQYYPPLPCDRSVNHYDPHRHARAPMPEGAGDEFPGAHPVEEPVFGQPLACESHHDFPPPGTLDYKPDHQFTVPRAFRAELESQQHGNDQGLHPRRAFEPSPFPSEEATR